MGEMAAYHYAGDRSYDQRGEQAPIDVTNQPMTSSRDQGQWHGMRNVRADEAHSRQSRVETAKDSHSQGACTNRRQRHKHAQHQAQSDC